MNVDADIHASHVAVISVREINSQWPSITNYFPTDRILHLMGETTRTRADIFAYISSLLYDQQRSCMYLYVCMYEQYARIYVCGIRIVSPMLMG